MTGARLPFDTGRYPAARPRRNRREPWSRRLVAETRLSVDDLIWPVFVHEGDSPAPVPSMPGAARQSITSLVDAAGRARDLGIPALAVFPATPEDRKTPDGEESANPGNLVCRAVRAVAAAVPDIGLVCDVALDPYTTHGHDGLVRGGEIANDETLEALVAQARVQAGTRCTAHTPPIRLALSVASSIRYRFPRLARESAREQRLPCSFVEFPGPWLTLPTRAAQEAGVRFPEGRSSMSLRSESRPPKQRTPRLDAPAMARRSARAADGP